MNDSNIITSYDLFSWCNCFNFPHQKCDECLPILGNVTNIREDECIDLNKENGEIILIPNNQ